MDPAEVQRAIHAMAKQALHYALGVVLGVFLILVAVCTIAAGAHTATPKGGQHVQENKTHSTQR